MVSAFMLSTSIFWGRLPFENSPGYANPTKEALSAFGKACYKEFELDDIANNLEKRYVPLFIKEYGVWPTLLIKATTEKRLSYEWTF